MTSAAAADNADGAKYIGEFISLVTKTDIRYQGFIFHLNSKDSIIGLRIVKSFGTEGQRNDGSQVPPRERTYEYKYFEGTDIKDVQVISPPPAQSTLNVPDDPAIIQCCFSPPTSSPVSLSSSGALQMTNITSNAQSAVHVPYSQGKHSLHSSIAGTLASSLPPLTLNKSMPAFPTYWPGHHLPSLSEGLIAAQPSQQQTNSSLMNVHFATNSQNVVEPHHSMNLPISLGAQNGLHALQNSPVSSLSGIPSMTPLSARGSQNGFPPLSPGVQNGLFPVPQMSTIDSPSGLPSVAPTSATSSQNGFPPVPPLSATYSLLPHKSPCSQNSLLPVGPLSATGSPHGLPSLPSSVTGSQDGFQPLPQWSTNYSPIPPSSPGSQSGLRPLPLLSVSRSLDAFHSLPTSSAAVNDFALATPSPSTHSDAGLFSKPSFNLVPSLLSNSTFSSPSTPADMKTQVAPSSSTSPHINSGTTSVKEVATSVTGPVAPCSSMLLSVKPASETRRDFVENKAIHHLDPLLQQEQIRLPSSINDYDPVQVSASVTLSSGSKNVKKPPDQIVKPQANKLQRATGSSQYHKTCRFQRPRDEDKDESLDHHSDRGYGKGRAKLPNGAVSHAQYSYRNHAKASGCEKDKDALHGNRSHLGYETGRKNLKDKDVLHGSRSPLGYEKGRENLKDRGALQGSRSHLGYQKGRKNLKDRDAVQGDRSIRGYGKGRENLPNGATAVIHTQHGNKSHAKARGHKVNGSTIHRSNGNLLSTCHLGKGHPSGKTKASRPVEKLSEDFNFEAMNEKFNKEEVWGLLGESTVAESEHKKQDGAETKVGDKPEAGEDRQVKVGNTPVYCKDDFFDTLSSNTLDQQSGRGRVKFSERKRLDNETFGEIQKHQRGRGILGPPRAGGTQGSYRGRGYDHRGRGRGKTP